MMNWTKESFPLAEAISIYELKSYLIGNGWKAQTHKNQKLVIFSKSDLTGNEIQLVLPSSEKFSDANRRKLDVMNALSQLQEEDLSFVQQRILAFGRDLWSFRILGEMEKGSISLDTAQHHLSGLKNLFLYSACSELRPAAYFVQPLPKASKFLSSCRFGYTFRGSFGFLVYNEILSERQTDDIFGLPPLSRRVAERIAKGLSLTALAVQKDNPDVLVENYKSAFNANMCDALLEMSLKSKKQVECSVVWANSYKPNESLHDFPPVCIGEAESKILEYASGKLKRVEPEAQKFIGIVTDLHYPRHPEEDASKRAAG